MDSPSSIESNPGSKANPEEPFMPLRTLIFTDLDGTLLDRHTYSAEKALPSMHKARERGIPIIFCSSKTPEEQIHLRQQLDIHDPFIVENGSALYIPEGFFARGVPSAKRKDGFIVLDLGLPGAIIRMHLAGIERRMGMRFKGMSRMELAEVMTLTGLDDPAARRAKNRAYSETLTAPLSPTVQARLNQELEKVGCHMVSGGKFHTVTSSSADKGLAVWLLTEIFRSEWGPLQTVGFGDGANDWSLLSRVDHPVLVRKPDGTAEPFVMDNLYTTEGIGPEGWVEAMEDVLRQVEH